MASKNKSLNWKDIAELIGIAAIVASLIFVGLQMRQTQRIALTEMDLNIMGAEFNSRSAIYDFPEVWAKGNAGDALEPSEAVIYQTLITDYNTLQFFKFSTAHALTGNADLTPASMDTAGFLYENPGARREWESLRAKYKRYRNPHQSNEYTSRFEQAVREDLAALDKMNDSAN